MKQNEGSCACRIEKEAKRGMRQKQKDEWKSWLDFDFIQSTTRKRASQVALVVKNPPANVRDVRDLGSTPGSGRSPGGGYGSPLQSSCLENSHGQRSLVGCVWSIGSQRVGQD